MYTGYGFRNFEIGDVDVVCDDGLYHLFHLTLPNHDYIAHAVSKDGIKWERVKNALFISDPKSWDDDMLWTMHVTPNPYEEGAWRMFYTGLCLRESGRVQRIGLAHSPNLYDWVKDDSGNYPLEISGDHYETSLNEGRLWVSFRDPFCYQEDGRTYLLATARTNKGPIIRRGCAALAEETAENKFEFLPPIFAPMRYDELEVPNLIKLKNRYYLIASIREDVKVHYWWANELTGPYYNYSDNVLMPQGNYAARISHVDGKTLMWNFFFKGLSTKGYHLMAPPKELAVDERGELYLKSFDGFLELITETAVMSELMPIHCLFDNPYAAVEKSDDRIWLSNESGFEAFLLDGSYRDFLLTGELLYEGDGKCGMVLHLDEDGDGYYISLDLLKGIVQIRAWGHKRGQEAEKVSEEAFYYEQLQAAHYTPADGVYPFQLLAYEQYVEFSFHGRI
jgi:beta-fructofuranosidase